MVEAIKRPELGSERRPAQDKAQEKAQEKAQDFSPNFTTIRETPFNNSKRMATTG